MTEAKPLTDDELRDLRSELPTVTDLHRQTPRGYDDMINADIARRLLATIADRDRIIAQAKLVAEQQAELVRELRDSFEKAVRAAAPFLPPVPNSPSADYHDSLHADALATEAEKAAGTSDRDTLKTVIREYTKDRQCMQQIEASRLAREVVDNHAPGLADAILAAGFTRQPRQLDPGEADKLLFDWWGEAT